MPNGFRIDLAEIGFLGADLKRPECVLCTPDGSVLTSDWGGGVAILDAQGRQRRLLGTSGGPKYGLLPNGFGLCRDGSLLLAHLNDQEGGVWRLDPHGRLSPFLLELDGMPLPPTNFVLVDGSDRVWITVSTRLLPRFPARRPDLADGYVILVDSHGARIVADGFGFTNELRLDASGEWLYVVETFGRRITRLRVSKDGALSSRETYVELGPGTFPDGIAFDVQGGLWIASIVSNRILRVAPDRSIAMVVEDHDPVHLAEFERDFTSGRLAGLPPEPPPARTLGNTSSLAFGGPDLKTVYVGCLLAGRIARFRSPVAGLPMAHWHAGTLHPSLVPPIT